MELKFNLIAEVIKHYSSKPEERAMSEYIMQLCDINLEEAQSLSVSQLANVVANRITENDDTPLRPRGPGRKPKALA